MNATILHELRQTLPGIVLHCNVSFREITSFGVGGELPVLVEPDDDIDLSRLVRFLSGRNVPFMVIGAGSNFAGMDRAFEGVAIRLGRGAFASIAVGRNHVTCGASVRLAELARTAAKAGFGGLAELAGIPGTLGGAIVMNASARGHSVGELILQLCGCRHNGSIWNSEGDAIEWRDHRSSVPDDVILTSAILKLPAADPDEELARINTEIALRRNVEPKGRTAGCVFRNVSPDEPAGRLIDECGLKGRRQGALEISSVHANYFVNHGEASESDLLTLMTEVRQRVAERFHFYLEPEVRFAAPDAVERFRRGAPSPSVAVLFGGVSSEREISLRSGRAVAGALRRGGYSVVEVDLQSCEMLPEMRTADVVYPVLHGGFGEDGTLQRLLEMNDIRFVGSGSGACALLMDKIATKRKLDELNLPTAPWGIVTASYRELPASLRYPVVIKPPREGSTIGIVKVENADQWEGALETAFSYDSVLLVEQFIRGVELTVPVIKGQALPVVEIRSPHGFYDYDAKYVYKDGRTEYCCPAPSLSAEQTREITDIATRFFREFGCRDMLRIDFIMGEDGIFYILEGNAIPGCTATSLVPKAAKESGLSFERLTSSLVQAALNRRS